MSVAPATRLGPYGFGSMLGAGGLGEVYRARDTRLDSPGASKVTADVLTADTLSRMRFRREAKATSASTIRTSARHGGRIWAESDGDRRGPTFFILPGIP